LRALQLEPPRVGRHDVAEGFEVKRWVNGFALGLVLGCAPTGDEAREIKRGLTPQTLKPVRAKTVEAPAMPSVCSREPERSIYLTKRDVLLLEEDVHPRSPDGLPLELDLRADVRTLHVSLVNRGRRRIHWCGPALDEDWLGLRVTGSDGKQIPAIPCIGDAS